MQNSKVLNSMRFPNITANQNMTMNCILIFNENITTQYHIRVMRKQVSY